MAEPLSPGEWVITDSVGNPVTAITDNQLSTVAMVQRAEMSLQWAVDYLGR